MNGFKVIDVQIWTGRRQRRPQIPTKSSPPAN